MSDLSFEQLRMRVSLETTELDAQILRGTIDWQELEIAYKQLGVALSNLKRVDIEQRAFEVSGVDL
jgi:hypothetical protein